MKKNLNKIIRESLIKQQAINERFERISIIESKQDRLFSTMDYLNELVDTGYGEDELSEIIVEQTDWLKKLFGWGTKNPQDAENMQKVQDVGIGGGISWFKEYAIETFLGFMGFKGPLANAIATAMSEMSLMDIVSVFRSREGCLAHSKAVARGISEALVRYIVESSTEKNSQAANFFRNMLFSLFQTAGYDKKLGQFVCNMAYKAKPTIISGAQKKTGL